MTKIREMIENEARFKYITNTETTNDKSSEVESSGYVDDINHIASNKNKEELEKCHRIYTHSQQKFTTITD